LVLPCREDAALFADAMSNALHKKYAAVTLLDPDGRVALISLLPLDGLFAEKTCTFNIAFGSGCVLKSVIVRP
jgi:hypothetical protein